jgi:hypothetical protein
LLFEYFGCFKFVVFNLKVLFALATFYSILFDNVFLGQMCFTQNMNAW